MADQGVIEYDAFDMEKMPTDTLKRNPKNMDLTKTELLRLLSYLEGELQGRDVTIAALKAEKAKQLMYQAKYGRFGLGDPFQALQRDSEWQKDQSFDETAVKSMYDNQLMQLENLIETQRKAQLRMREQLAAVEKRYHKVCAELEDEKRRHAQDAEEGDNVTCMLEKERERLKQELEFEKTQNKKLEKELKKTNISTEEEKGMADKHKVVAVELIKERNKLIEKLIVLHQRNKQLEQTLKDEQDKTKEMAEGLAHKGQLALQLEANLEKNLSDYDTEREQLKLKLSREESKNRELTLEVEKLKFQIEQMQRHLEEQPIKAGSQATEIINDSNKASKNSLSVNSTEKKSSSPNVSVAVSPTVSPRSMQHEITQRPNILPLKPNLMQQHLEISYKSQTLENPSSPSVEKSVDSIVSVGEPQQGTDRPPLPSQPPPPPPRSSSTTLEFLGTEMEDLHDILISMASENAEENSSMSSGDLEDQFLNSQLNVDADQSIGANSVSSKPESREVFKEQRKNVVDKESISYQQLLLKFIEDSEWFSLQEYLNHHAEVNVNQELVNGSSIGHFVAEKGQLDCLRLVINRGANVNLQNHEGYTLLHCAVVHNQLGCCKILLEFGASLEIKSKEELLNVFHLAAKYGATDIFELLIEHCVNNCPEILSKILEDVDTDGNNVVFLTAMHNNVEMLEIIAKHCDIDVTVPNQHGKTVLDVASPHCKDLLQKQEPSRYFCTVAINISPPNHQSDPKNTGLLPSSFIIGHISVSKDTTWQEIEGFLGDVLLQHFSEVFNGLKSRKSMLKTDATCTDGQQVTSMGLSFDSVKYFGIGIYFWSPGTPSEKKPYDLLHNSQLKQISVKLFGYDDASLDNFAYESLIPLPQLYNYLRLMEQFGNVILYGPNGSGKTYVCRRLTQILQAKEVQMGCISEINFVAIHDRFTKNDLHSLLFQTGCLLHSAKPMPHNYTSILVLDGLEKTNVTELFADISTLLTSRGPKTAVNLVFDNKGPQSYYLHSKCYILGTMDQARLPVLTTALQQSFKWVHFKPDQEPMKYLLHRQFYRQLLHQYSGSLPSSDNVVLKSMEWIICVWLRLNEGLLKLGLQDLIIGPATFLSCPLEVTKPKAILRWLNILWNQKISSAVGKAVMQGSGKETSVEGQNKLANTALYVLMQRSIVSGCPLQGQEKDRYLSSFQGSNELDIKIRKDKSNTNTQQEQSFYQANSHQGYTDTANDQKLQQQFNQNFPNSGLEQVSSNLTAPFVQNPEANGQVEFTSNPDYQVGGFNNISRQGINTVVRNPLQKSASVGSNSILSANTSSPNPARKILPSSNGNIAQKNSVPEIPNTLSLFNPNIVKSTEPPKSFGSSMFALSGTPTGMKNNSQQDNTNETANGNLRNFRSNSVSNSIASSSFSSFSATLPGGNPLSHQYSRAILAGSPLPQSGTGSRSPAQHSPRSKVQQQQFYQSYQPSPPSKNTNSGVPPSTDLLSAGSVNNNNPSFATANINNNMNRNIPVPMRQGLMLNSKPALPAVSGTSNIAQSVQHIVTRANYSASSTAASFTNMSFQQKTDLIVGMNSPVGLQQNATDTNSLRRAFSPTAQQLKGSTDYSLKPDMPLRRSFSPSPDLILSRRAEKGPLPFSLPKK